MKTSKLNKNDLSRVKAFYESEYHSTLSKLEHLKSILKKLKNVSTEISSEKIIPESTNFTKKTLRRGRKPSIVKDAVNIEKPYRGRPKKASGKKAQKVSAVKTLSVAKNEKAKNRDISSQKTKPPRTYIHWSKIITGVLSENKKPMRIRDIVASCLSKKGITKSADKKRAKLSIQNLVYRLKDNKKISVYHINGDKYQSYCLPKWIKNGILDEKILK